MTPKQEAAIDSEIIEKMTPDEFAVLKQLDQLPYSKNTKIVVALGKARRAYIRGIK
jgi:hypothetical protein